MWSLGCGVWNVARGGCMECGMSGGCQVWSVDCRVRGAKLRVWDIYIYRVFRVEREASIVQPKV